MRSPWCLVAVLAALPGAGCASYAADPVALDALVSSDAVTVSREHSSDPIRFTPREPVTDVGVVFYPGGLVEPEAYARPMRALAEAGVRTVIVPMPSDLAVFAPHKADRVIDDGPWVIAGHSLGGAMAATHLARRDGLEGLVLWAAYPSGSVDLSSDPRPVLSLTATEDGVLDRETWDDRRAQLPPHTAFVSIEGGNHAGFGDYGPQDGDGQATLTPGAQHAVVVETMLGWLRDET